tara:strand:+ start:312 stop:458 length:147 start_codon:yes stop_codon:yes gene_type:complete
MTKWHGGKGSSPRKTDDAKQYAENWEKIFGNKDKPKPLDETEQEINKE